MDTNSEAYKSGEYEEVFEAADTWMLAAEDFELYSASAEAVREHEAAVAYAANKAEERGRAEGVAKGILKVVRNMLNYGIPKEQVAAINNMTVAEINRLIGEE